MSQAFVLLLELLGARFLRFERLLPLCFSFLFSLFLKNSIIDGTGYVFWGHAPVAARDLTFSKIHFSRYSVVLMAIGSQKL